MERMIHIFLLCALTTAFTALPTHPIAPGMAEQDNVPALNQRVVDFVKGKMGKKVGAGECWDLAAEALNTAGARWDGLYGFGEVVDWKKAEVFAGDIVQFENVEVERREGDMVRRERYGHHTAVILEVREKGVYTIGQQNMQGLGRKVGLGELAMSDVRGGKIVFYRPVE
ncbi:MAG: hypothetical protein ABI432_19060 [Flavobacteriales bacterium]